MTRFEPEFHGWRAIVSNHWDMCPWSNNIWLESKKNKENLRCKWLFLPFRFSSERIILCSSHTNRYEIHYYLFPGTGTEFFGSSVWANNDNLAPFPIIIDLRENRLFMDSVTDRIRCLSHQHWPACVYLRRPKQASVSTKVERLVIITTL